MFYEQHRRELYTYALSLTGRRQTAEDAIHAAFCNVLRRGKTPRALRPYVFRCVRNVAIDEGRRAQRETRKESLFLPPEATCDLALQVRLEESMDALSDKERESVVLKVCDSLTLSEIAELRSVSINTAASWYRRGMEKLRRMMNGGSSDEGS